MNELKNIVICILTIILINSCTSSNILDQNKLNNISNNNYWRTIASAMQIVVIHSSELVNENIELNKYYEYIIKPIKTLKGSEQESIKFNIYMNEEIINYINSLQYENNVIIFLTISYDGYDYNKYLASYYIENAIIEYTYEVAIIINEEIELQNNIIRNKLYEKFKQDKKVYSKVKGYINRSSNILFQANSFKKLLNFEENGVPYIILHMDNFKKLPINSITLENRNPNAFERYRHYGPELVIDALDAILNQITGEYFGNIVNGEATEEMRLSVLNGWRVYLFKLMIN